MCGNNERCIQSCVEQLKYFNPETSTILAHCFTCRSFTLRSFHVEKVRVVGGEMSRSEYVLRMSSATTIQKFSTLFVVLIVLKPFFMFSHVSQLHWPSWIVLAPIISDYFLKVALKSAQIFKQRSVSTQNVGCESDLTATASNLSSVSVELTVFLWTGGV